LKELVLVVVSLTIRLLTQVAYYISSLVRNAIDFAVGIRGHWGIEIVSIGLKLLRCLFHGGWGDLFLDPQQ
jgi:hypothetical protein